MPDAQVTADSRAAYYFIIVTVFLDFLAFGIIAPVLPNLILQFEGGSISRASAITAWFGFAWATMQFIFSPILGAWSDRFGRRPVILLSCLGLGLDYILMALSPNLSWLLVGRIISGITTSNVSTAFAYITDVTAPAERAKKFGMLGAAFGMGFVIGPALGGLFSGNSGTLLRMPFKIAAGLSLANFLYGYFVLPESLPRERRAKSAWHMANPFGALTLLRSHKELFGLSAVATLFYLAHQALPSVFVLYTKYRYGWSVRQVGVALTVVGVCAAAVSGGLVGPYVKKFGERFGLISGLTYGVIGFAGFAIAARGSILLAAIPFIALWGFAGPAMQSLMSRHVDHTSQGKLQGAINSIRGITGMVGPPLFGNILSYVTSPETSWHLIGAPYYLSAILLSSALLLSIYVTRAHAFIRSAAEPSPESPSH